MPLGHTLSHLFLRIFSWELKMFLKMDDLMCALKPHILAKFIFIYIWNLLIYVYFRNFFIKNHKNN